jgi:hypothetical protein
MEGLEFEGIGEGRKGRGWQHNCLRSTSRCFVVDESALDAFYQQYVWDILKFMFREIGFPSFWHFSINMSGFWLI